MRTLFAPLLLIGILWMARWWILAVLAAIVVGLAVWLRHQRKLDASSSAAANAPRWWPGRISNTRVGTGRR